MSYYRSKPDFNKDIEMTVNSTILIGNLGKDAVSEMTKNDKPVCKFSIATVSPYGKDAGAVWHNCKAYGKLADICKNLKKGEQVYVEGAINNSKYEKDEHTNYYSEIIIVNIRFLTPKELKTSDQQQGEYASDNVGF